jgi:hypothetical protein
MFKNTILLTITIISLFAFNACKTDLNLNGPYQRIPIVMGLLNSNDSIHLIKITRTYLGNGDNYEYAKIPDSNYFDAVDAQVIEYDGLVETGRKWQLHDTIIPNKEEGVFYYPEQKVYVFYENNLDETKNYKLVADLDEGDYQIDATTNMTNGFQYYYLLSATGYTLSLAYDGSSSTGTYPSARINYKEAYNGKYYLTSLVFKYRETYADNSTKTFSIEYSDKQLTQNDPNNPIDNNDIGQEAPTFEGEEFYKFVGNNISPNNNVIKREFIGIDFYTNISNEVLATYMELSKPQSTIAGTKPTYTNINSSSDKALGIFACRQTVWLQNMQLNSASMKELCVGQYTNTLGFCSNLPEHNTESFYCQ